MDRMGFAAAVLLVAACGGRVTEQINPCADRDASYRFTYVETSGTCGPMVPGVLSVGRVGLTSPDECDNVLGRGSTCTAVASCMSSDGCQVATDMTFAPDGSGATGTMTTSCPTCTSSYEVTGVLQ